MFTANASLKLPNISFRKKTLLPAIFSQFCLREKWRQKWLRLFTSSKKE